MNLQQFYSGECQQTALSNLETTDTPSIEQILNILISRDRLQKLLSQDNQDTAAFLISVLELDERPPC